MLYGSLPHVKKPISRLVFGTATPKMFAAFRSVYGVHRILTSALPQLSPCWMICTQKA